MPVAVVVRSLLVAFLVAWGAGLSGVEAAEAVVHPIVPGYERLFREPKADLVAGGQLLLGELKCVACHRGTDGANESLLPKQAPELTGVTGRVRMNYLRAFLADPGHAKPGTLMPGLLGTFNPAERAADVEALVHFLASTGGGQPPAQIVDASAAKRGENLYHQIGCVACHGPRKERSVALATSVPLGEPLAKFTIPTLMNFLREPHKLRPSGRMPSLNLTEQEARDIAHYLCPDRDAPANMSYSYYEGSWDKVPDFTSLKPIATGTSSGLDLSLAKRENDYGMRFEGFFHVAEAGMHSFFLTSDDGSKVYVDGVEVADCDGIHPPQEIKGRNSLAVGTHTIVVDYFNAGGGGELNLEIAAGRNRQSISSFVSLAKERPASSAAEFLVDARLAERGRALFASRGCASCHEIRDAGAVVASELKARPLTELAPERGCLALPPAASPIFSLDDGQRKSLQAAIAAAGHLASNSSRPQPLIARTLATFNCYACHARDSVGGVESARNDFFETTAKEMGDEARIPPQLTGVGAKLKPKWLKSVLDKGSKDRPYMLTRMPRFGGENIGHLAGAFAALDKIEPVAEVKFDLPPYRVEGEGRTLVGGNAFSCVKCHNFGKYKGEGIQAIDMTIMTNRLNRDWFHRYLRDPPAFRPGTRMPQAWPKKGPSMLRAILDGDSEKQIEAVWVYLSDGAKAAAPLGVSGTPIHLVPETEPIVYRNFIEGAGPRAIAVGYPEKVNLAFDAGQLRLALVWHGAFIDASPHWSGRGQGFQPPLGDHTIPLTAGVPLAKLKLGTETWPVGSGKELGYQFRGYELDAARRPTFFYNFGDVQIHDFAQPTAGERGPGLRRTLTLETAQPVDHLWFRAAVAGQIEPLADGWYKIDKSWKMRLEAADAQPVVRKTSGQSELLLPIVWSNSKATITQTFDW